MNDGPLSNRGFSERGGAARIAWLVVLLASPFLGFVAGAFVAARFLGLGDSSLGMVWTNYCALAGAVGAPVALVFARTIYRRTSRLRGRTRPSGGRARPPDRNRRT